MAFGTLYTIADDNPRSIGIRAIAHVQKLDLECVDVDIRKPTADHLRAHGMGKIPAFAGQDGVTLMECSAIAVYLASQGDGLLGRNKVDLQWMSFFNSEIATSLSNWFQPLVGWRPYDQASVETNSKAVLKALDVVETHLRDREFLVGETLSAADYFCAGLSYRGFQFFLDRPWREQHPNLTRWYQMVTEQPAYVATTERLKMLEDPALVNEEPSEKTIRENRLPLSKSHKASQIHTHVIHRIS
ncbi:hypothetical protein CDD80_7144 [Ophiocordyceps camponoti-rufipedis]|uniref:GST C-terminal domain-containing protein n=1 Tax=Ophiocordyceps camponoti-rufipedis TaxID=2004952 RepID=A0A2C5ZGE5_9HYPO|nr:hypothetical protein CDD80_7144 [Ophiocordyceps camponoti-rufipedis]